MQKDSSYLPATERFSKESSGYRKNLRPLVLHSADDCNDAMVRPTPLAVGTFPDWHVSGCR